MSNRHTQYESISYGDLSYIIEYLAYIVGKYLTRETGVQVEFGSAIVPHLKDGSIRLRDVIASRTFEGLPESANINRNQSKFQLSIQSIDVKLSLLRLLKGRLTPIHKEKMRIGRGRRVRGMEELA
jgi:hypothetical protein